LDEEEVEFAVLFEDGGAFGFGGVCGEDGFNVDVGEGGEDIVFAEALFLEAGEVVYPGSGFRGGGF
jgi:hypothetical protein